MIARLMSSARLVKRPPIVTIMGHVDHGKTSLLDALRNSQIALGEAGAITQHIGAFSVQVENDWLTFLDTPGHEAFGTMRSRGSKVTDIIILVVAADDGVMPQTLESIKLAQKDNVPLIVALNKMDKGVDKKVDAVKRDLMSAGVELEGDLLILKDKDMGGNVQIVPISAKTKLGLENLKEAILVQSEIMELQGDPNGDVQGDVIEAKTSVGFGPLATVLVSKGTLKIGDLLVAGDTWAKVRSMKNEKGQAVKMAGLSSPVEVSGWKSLPKAGDHVFQVKSESMAKKCILNELSTPIKPQEPFMVKKNKLTKLDRKEPDDPRESEGPLTCRIIVKADVQGSLEALLNSVFSLPSHQVKVDVVASGIGPITDSDLDLASTTNSSIFAFNVNQTRKVLSSAENRKISLFQHNIIYSFLDDLIDNMSSLLPDEKVYSVIGEGQILEIFQLRGKQAQKIAGCKIKTGKITKSGIIKIIRKQEEIYNGSICTFKHHKKDITEASKGLECGIGFQDFDGFEPDDLVQCLSMTLVKRKISCIVKSYLQWLQDSDFESCCSFCKQSLQGTIVRLSCLDLAHVDCINQSLNSYPEHTAPAGYACLSCQKPVISNESTQIATIIRDTFKNSKWAEPILNSLIKQVSSTPRNSTTEPFTNSKLHVKIPVYDIDPDNDKYGDSRRISSSSSALFQSFNNMGFRGTKKYLIYLSILGFLVFVIYVVRGANK